MTVFAMFGPVLIGGFLIVLAAVLLLNIFGLPGNWVMLGMVALYHIFCPVPTGLTVWYWVIVVAIGVLGELCEMGLQIVHGRKFGSTGTGTVGGVIGAIAGAILMAPLFFGLGAFVGALAGAWTGCFLFELMKGRSVSEAARAALGCMIGRFFGTVCKLACGGVMLAVTAQYIWPEPSALPFRFPWLPAPGPGSLPDSAQQVMNCLSVFFA